MEKILPKRRWFQFSLRTMFVAVTLIAVPVGWLASKIEQGHRQGRLLAKIRAYSGKVYYCDQWSLETGPKQQSDEDAQPGFLRRLFGDDFLRPVALIEVNLAFQDKAPEKLSADDFNSLEELDQLRLLAIDGGSIPDPFLTPNLQEYRSKLESMPISDATLAHLARLIHLEYLALSNTLISDGGLKHLAGLRQLKGLTLYGAAISDDGLVSLESMDQLEALSLVRTKITDNGLVHLSGMTKLKKLELNGTEIDGSGLLHPTFRESRW